VVIECVDSKRLYDPRRIRCEMFLSYHAVTPVAHAASSTRSGFAEEMGKRYWFAATDVYVAE